MPGIPLVTYETANSGCNCSYSRTADHMCRLNSHVPLSTEEEIVAEQSLSVYCKPVELYNILQRRAIRNLISRKKKGKCNTFDWLEYDCGYEEPHFSLAIHPLRFWLYHGLRPAFLQRCLHYKIQAKHKKRIQMTISLMATMNNGLHTGFSPLYVLLARPFSHVATTRKESANYCFRRACVLTSCSTVQGINQNQAKFILPDINKLSAEVKCASLLILLISSAEIRGSFWGSDRNEDYVDIASFPSNIGVHCLWGKIPMELLCLSCERSPNLSLGDKAEILSTVDMHSGIMKTSCFDEGRCISFEIPHETGVLEIAPLQVQVLISAEEVGAKERSPYDSYSVNEISSSSMSHIMRLRAGNVIFNYRYYNNRLQRTEVTEDFSCPFCLVKCASFKGLRYHLSSSHDLFNFEFWVNEEYQAVNVSVKTDSWRTEIVADGVDPKQQTFSFCSKPVRRKSPRSLGQNAKHVHPFAMDSDLPPAVDDFRDKTDGNSECAEHDIPSPNSTWVSSAAAHLHADPECVQSVPGSNIVPPAILQFAKTRKLSLERDPRNRVLLQKRQFYHSHRAQPMEMEQVLSDRDSEDEVDDDVADLEDRRMLDDFVDVTKHEKQMMHLWNSFVRKQHVLADGHIPWACEAFSKLHRQAFLQAPSLLWCWRFFMIKLWNHGLLDARTMNNCNILLEQCQSTDLDSAKN